MRHGTAASGLVALLLLLLVPAAAADNTPSASGCPTTPISTVSSRSRHGCAAPLVRYGTAGRGFSTGVGPDEPSTYRRLKNYTRRSSDGHDEGARARAALFLHSRGGTCGDCCAFLCRANACSQNDFASHLKIPNSKPSTTIHHILTARQRTLDLMVT